MDSAVASGDICNCRIRAAFPTATTLPSNSASDSLARVGLKIANRSQPNSPFGRAYYDGTRQRVFTRALQTRDQSQQFAFVHISRRHYRDQSGLSFG